MYLQFPQVSERLTEKEQRILEYIENNKEEFLFMTIGQLAEHLSVSEATISRFVKHVGCKDYKRLKQFVLEQNQIEGPAGKMAGTLFGEGEFNPVDYLEQQQRYLQKTAEFLTEEEFQQAIQAMISAKRIFIHGKSASSSLARILEFRLRRLGIHVVLLPSGGSEVMEGLAQVGEEDLVILFSFSKVSQEGKAILSAQKLSKYKTLAFTSRHHIQEEKADINLFVYRGAEKEYHSMTTAMAMIDAVIVALTSAIGASGAKHMKKIHNMKKEFRKM